MNRTKIIMKATCICIFVFLLQGALTLLRTKVFIEFYGSEVNGVIELTHQIFSYIILLESGLGSAYLFKMYMPMTKSEYNKVNGLYKGLTNSLKKISLLMFAILLIIAFIYPVIMNKNTLSYFKIVFIILLLGIRFILPYYFTISKKNLLYVYEKKYIADFIDGMTSSLILALEIFLSKYLGIDVIITLFIGIGLTLIANYIYSYIIKKECKDVLNTNSKPNYEARTMTKDIFIHQVSSVVFSSTDNIILSIFSTLNNVTIYSAYNTILTYPTTLITKIIDNLRATFGKKMVENKEQAVSIFYQTISLNYLITAISAPLFYLLINDFIELWIGRKFILNNVCIILFTLLYIHRCIIPTIYIARDAKGLYKESKNYTLIQAIVNIVISLVLVKKYEILGLLIGTVISTYLILIPANYNLVCKKVLNIRNNLLLYLVCLILYTGVIIFICNYINNILLKFTGITWNNFILKAIIDVLISTSISSVLMYLTNNNFKKILKRFIDNSRIKNILYK